MDDMDLEIPAILRIPQPERAAAWRGYKPKQSLEAVDQAAAWQRMEQQRKEAKAEKARGRIANLKAKKAAEKQHDAIPTSQRRWCARTNRWVAAI